METGQIETSPELTPRQREMLCLLTLPNKQIAVTLGITTGGVKNRLTGLYRALLGPDPNRRKGARIRALTKALVLGLVEMDDIVDGKWPMVKEEDKAKEVRIRALVKALVLGLVDGK